MARLAEQKGRIMRKRLGLVVKILATAIIVAILLGMLILAFNLQLW